MSAIALRDRTTYERGKGERVGGQSGRGGAFLLTHIALGDTKSSIRGI